MIYIEILCYIHVSKLNTVYFISSCDISICDEIGPNVYSILVELDWKN